MEHQRQLSLRAGVDNVFDKWPSLIGTVSGTTITGPSAGYPGGTDLTAVCGSAPNA